MGDENKDKPFDIKFKALPPDLAVKLWTLALDADTSKVGIAYKPGAHHEPGLQLFGEVFGGPLRSPIVRDGGICPLTQSLDLGLVYKGFKFGATENFQTSSTGLTLDFGAPIHFPTNCRPRLTPRTPVS